MYLCIVALCLTCQTELDKRSPLYELWLPPGSFFRCHEVKPCIIQLSTIVQRHDKSKAAEYLPLRSLELNFAKIPSYIVRPKSRYSHIINLYKPVKSLKCLCRIPYPCQRPQFREATVVHRRMSMSLN